ncbi:MAG: VOC family protein [Defluviitaleaceae bacterium]|nr:VOC family protein [Defluviitaleaceae bacterium]
MITGLEVCMVIPSSISALELYEKIFEVERIEVSDFGVGTSEVVLSIYGSRIHLLDENAEHMLIAPKAGDPCSSWLNVAVPDINSTFKKALDNGCQQVVPITEMPAMGLKNAMFSDPFGYMWMLHQIDKVVSHEERMKMFQDQKQ